MTRADRAAATDGGRGGDGAGPDDTLVLRAVRQLNRRAAPAGGGGADGIAALRDVGREPTALAVASAPPFPVDRARLAALGCIDPRGGRSPLAEDLRIVKRPLLAHALAPGARPRDRVVAVVSALPGEGRTFAAVNLALSLSLERDASVLLIDGDQARAGAARTLGVPQVPGLAELLSDRPANPALVLVRTDIERLIVVPPGTPSDSMPELLGSRLMAATLDTILAADARRLVIIDTPPVLGGSDALALAALAGQVVLLVDAGATPRARVDDALRLLGDHPRVWLLLNRAGPGAGGLRTYDAARRGGGRGRAVPRQPGGRQPAGRRGGAGGWRDDQAAAAAAAPPPSPPAARAIAGPRAAAAAGGMG